MPTITQARQAIRTRLENGAIVNRDAAAVPLRWQNEDVDSTGIVPLPDVPSPFIYTEFLAEPGSLASFGGGRGQNLYRNPARVVAYVFVPKDDGLEQAEDIAEQIAVLLRSHRDATVSCFDATVHPGGDGAQLTPSGLASEVGNYFWASVEISMFYDQIG